MNPITANRRHFEDLALGEVVELGQITVTKEMITSFAREFDPFPFHLDEEAARKSLLGGLASSGWQTAGLTLRLLTDAFLSRIASAGGLGFSDLKWRRPVMKNDTLTGTGRIIQLRRSRNHPQWGVLTIELDMRNQKNEPVMTMKLANLIETRTPDVVSHEQPAQPYDVDTGHSS
jgi:acyl dehydratase